MTGHALHEMGGRVVAKVGGHVADPESTVRRKVRAELVRRLVENLEIKKNDEKTWKNKVSSCGVRKYF